SWYCNCPISSKDTCAWLWPPSVARVRKSSDFLKGRSDACARRSPTVSLPLESREFLIVQYHANILAAIDGRQAPVHGAGRCPLVLENQEHVIADLREDLGVGRFQNGRCIDDDDAVRVAVAHLLQEVLHARAGEELDDVGFAVTAGHQTQARHAGRID